MLLAVANISGGKGRRTINNYAYRHIYFVIQYNTLALLVLLVLFSITAQSPSLSHLPLVHSVVVRECSCGSLRATSSMSILRSVGNSG